ncbi:MAG: hypothetical protein EA382_07735 [Spirochaetaceae bacterium]|nr:MAG: hypothetical protein EA382_07735 [Spirochaetaceae bacterium]
MISVFARLRARVLCTAGVFVACAVALSGCIDVDAHVSLRDNGSGDIDLVYRIEAAAYETAVFGTGSGGRSVPVTRADFDDAAQLLPGLTVRSHRTSTEDGSVVVRVRLSFSDQQTLIGLLGPESVSIEQTGRSGTWRQIVAPANPVDPTAIATLLDALEPYHIRLRLSVGHAIESSAPGTVASDRRSAEYSVSLADIAATPTDLVWTVVW